MWYWALSRQGGIATQGNGAQGGMGEQNHEQ
ncbi:MAG: hypothetical protein K0R47_781 [Brevibacillus sp.]|nr:hypothetical protein [Brevibacillus sp.]